MFRTGKRTQPQPVHRGRIYRAGDWWHYRCTVCDYGAGTFATGFATQVQQWLVEVATDHATVMKGAR
jgi:hypothetical protein